MNYKFFSLILLIANAVLVTSKVTFRLIAVSGTPYCYTNNKKYPMKEEQYPVFTLTLNSLVGPINYHYGIDDKEESFTRTLNSESTLNEFFNRKQTVYEHPLLPKAFESFPTLKKSKLFDDTHIGNFILQADQNEIDNLHAHPDKDKLKVTVKAIYVSPYTVKVFNNAYIKISGQSTKYSTKLSYKLGGLKTDDDKELYGRTAVKLRAEYNDPSFMREKNYF
jgi:hypothetical protein